MKKPIYLTALLFCIPLFAQDDSHLYWEFNTEPLEKEGDQYDEHLRRFLSSTFEQGNACTENTDDGNYICVAQVDQDECSNNSNYDFAIVTLNYEGEEINREVICDFYDDDNTQSEEPKGLVYQN
ncbi:MAG TPA: hypothetical protein EYN82_08470 [Candidatus Marinimicrobia bacterium]|nr:hypothetical protein [Candidatus Neomarinimicrobiota bacterium]